MFKIFYPYAYAQSVFTIDYDKLYAMGYRGLIFDIDNTLVHHGDDSTPEIDQLFKDIEKTGLKAIMLSNNLDERCKSFVRNIDAPYICDAEKPKTFGYYKAVEMLGIKKEEAICIGDQVFTDIRGANRCKMASILVKFIQPAVEVHIGKRRQVERLILKFYRKNKSCYNRLGDIEKKRLKENAV